MSEPRLELPDGVWPVEGPHGVRLRGFEHLVAGAVERLRALKDQPDGYCVRLGIWTLSVSEYVPERPQPKIVTMPGHAWNVAASVLRDAAYGEYRQNPFDFGDVGYLEPPPSPDIGVEVLIDPAWSDMGPPFTSQCRVCLRHSPRSDDRESVNAWLADHETQHEGPKAPEP